MAGDGAAPSRSARASRTLIEPAHVNLGIAVDVERKGGSRSLMVPCIKGADTLDFAGFHSYYEELITKTRENKLTADDFQGTNITPHQPRRPRHGRLGAAADERARGRSSPRGSIAYPVEWAHAPPDKIKALGISKVMTMTSTYDHRIIQGAESGSFLRRIEQLLQGEDDFYESVAESLGVDADAVVTSAHPGLGLRAARSPAPRRPPRRAVAAQPDTELLQAVQAATSLLKAYRTHGHLAARLDPLGSRAEGRPGDRAGEPQPDPRADVADPGVDPPDRRRGRDAAGGAAADARGLLRHDRLPDRAPLLAPAADVAHNKTFFLYFVQFSYCLDVAVLGVPEDDPVGVAVLDQQGLQVGHAGGQMLEREGHVLEDQ